jgi:hypothetical protein
MHSSTRYITQNLHKISNFSILCNTSECCLAVIVNFMTAWQSSCPRAYHSPIIGVDPVLLSWFITELQKLSSLGLESGINFCGCGLCAFNLLAETNNVVLTSVFCHARSLSYREILSRQFFWFVGSLSVIFSLKQTTFVLALFFHLLHFWATGTALTGTQTGVNFYEVLTFLKLFMVSSNKHILFFLSDIILSSFRNLTLYGMGKD